MGGRIIPVNKAAVRVSLAMSSIVYIMMSVSFCLDLSAQIELAEAGGTFADGNLATAEGAIAFGSDELDLGIHFIANINDGIYGNSGSWIGGGAEPPFVGIQLGGPRTVASIAFGRDNGGEAQVFTDRAVGLFILQYTTVASPDATTPAEDWVTIGELEYDCIFPDATPWLRHRYNTPAVEATGIRLLVPFTGIAGGTSIDEIEIYAEPGAVTAPQWPEIMTPTVVGGPITTPAFADDVPNLEEGNLARGMDAIPFGTPPYPAAAHTIPHLNDGLYGNANSWLGNELGAASGKVYAGVYFSDGPKELAQIALGRDNTGQFSDRMAGISEIQYTQDEFDPADDGLTDGATWTTIGFVELCRNGAPSRQLYGFDSVTARAVRVLTTLGNVFDEIEMGLQIGTPPPPVLRLLETGGPLTTPAAPEDVPGADDGNFARLAGAVAFGTPPHSAPAHEIAHLNDGMYGNDNSWLGIEPGATSGKVYFGIYFTEEIQRIQSIAIGRDNTGTLVDRVSGAYLVQYTLDAFDFTDDAAVEGAIWNIAGEAKEHSSDGQPGLRHVYCLEGIPARAIRVVTALGNVVDEIELLVPPRGQELVLAEVGGSFAEDNLATAEGAIAFAPDSLSDVGFDEHTIEHLSDGLYGNSYSWIGNTGDPGMVGIGFGGLMAVSSIAFGRDNGGPEEEPIFVDRTAGIYTLQYTRAEIADVNTSDCDWQTIGYVEFGEFCPPTAWLRHRFNFSPVEATGIRLLVPGTGLADGTAIDELEVYSEPSAGSVECVHPETLTLVETGGPIETPAMAGDVPALADGNLARLAGAVPFGTPPHPAPAHEIEHLNDGLYGNANSWLGNEVSATSGLVYAGILFLEAGPQEIFGIAIGRDNTGQATDRVVGSYLIQYTTGAFDPADTASIDAVTWDTIGAAQAHLTDDTAHLRHRYSFDPVTVRAIRVITTRLNVIDEIELIGSPPPPPNNSPTAVITTIPDTAEVTLSDGMAEVTLDGNGSDDGDDSTQGLSYSWEKVSGPAGDTIATSTEAVTRVTFTLEGEFVYRLTVDDGQALDSIDTAEVTVTVLADPEPVFRRGDANASGKIDLSDGVFIFSFLFLGGPAPVCPDAADSNDEGMLTLTSGVYILNFLFTGGSMPPSAYPDCDVDPTDDELGECMYPQEYCE